MIGRGEIAPLIMCSRIRYDSAKAIEADMHDDRLEGWPYPGFDALSADPASFAEDHGPEGLHIGHL